MTQMEEQRVRRTRLIFLMVAGAIGIMFLVIGVYQLVEFMDSTAFCGKLCHTVMYPEYTVYQGSPHSSVTCSQCHVGSGADYLVKSKLSGIPLIITTLTGGYDRPIATPVNNLRPARETCEQCHRPSMFFGDVVLTRTTYAQDVANTATTDTRILRVGGGQAEVAKDIHWHVASEVWYLPLDEKRDEIAWVGVVDKNGQVTEYWDMSKVGEITNERVQKEGRLMDCIDCHNRATHIFRSPEELIDEAMLQGLINTSLPYVKREAMQALNTTAPSLEAAYKRVEAIQDFYSANYPDLTKYKQTEIATAITQLKTIAKLTTFPEMNVSWQSYTDNVSHISSPGCMRCHGKLVATSGPQKDQTVRADCTLCHYFQTPNPGQ